MLKSHHIFVLLQNQNLQDECQDRNPMEKRMYI
nr:MAG TPA_asm: hypothetical protein [Caudoviricetes sp.]